MAQPQDPVPEGESRRAQAEPKLFKGHTLSEAGQSWWAPLWLLVTLRTLFALGLVALAIFLLVSAASIISNFQGWVILLSTAFWGPILHAIGLVLLVICGVRGRSSSSGSSSSSKLPNVAVPLYQMGCTFTVFDGIVFIVGGALRASSSGRAWPSILIGVFEVLIFLVEFFVLGAMVRFRFGYIWISTLLFALSMIAPIIVVATSLASSSGSVGIALGLSLGFVFAFLVTSVVVTLLTRVVPMCCLSGRQLRVETVADEIEE